MIKSSILVMNSGCFDQLYPSLTNWVSRSQFPWVKRRLHSTWATVFTDFSFFPKNNEFVVFDDEREAYQALTKIMVKYKTNPLPSKAGVSYWVRKWVRSALNGTNPVLFQIRSEPECTRIQIRSDNIPDLSHFETTWLAMGPNLTSVFPDCKVG